MNMEIKQQEAEIKKIEQLAKDAKSITLEVKDTKIFSFTPGQFVMVAREDNPKVRRAFSIASAQSKNTFELCIREFPDGGLSTTLCKSREKDRLLIDGPYGNFTLRETEADLILIAAGTGIAPIRSMLQSVKDTNKKIWLLYRFKDLSDYLYKNELEKIARENKNIQVIASTNKNGSEWTGETERIQNFFAKYITDINNKEVYICGPPDMVRDTIKYLEEFGFSKEQLHKEMW